MDRRQKKTREAIFKAFTELLTKKHFNNITVGEIIDGANIGRATFYAHFETKDFLLKELCKELFYHIFDSIGENRERHKHIFDCDAPPSMIEHLFAHIQNNDNKVLSLLACENNELFLKYFKENLKELIQRQAHIFNEKKEEGIPDSYWINHVCATFVETLRWWIENGMKESAKILSDYFFSVI